MRPQEAPEKTHGSWEAEVGRGPPRSERAQGGRSSCSSAETYFSGTKGEAGEQDLRGCQNRPARPAADQLSQAQGRSLVAFPGFQTFSEGSCWPGTASTCPPSACGCHNPVSIRERRLCMATGLLR